MKSLNTGRNRIRLRFLWNLKVTSDESLKKGEHWHIGSNKMNEWFANMQLRTERIQVPIQSVFLKSVWESIAVK